MLQELFLLASIKTADLNSRLQVAVCSQNWRSAIGIVDEMTVAAPSYRQQLTTYRGRLTQLGTTRIPTEFLPGCSPPVSDTILPFTETSYIKLDLPNLWINPEDANIRVVPFSLIEGGTTYPGGRIAINCANQSSRAELADGRIFANPLADAIGTRILESICNQ